LCTRKLEKRTSKRGKPYFVCDFCGIQLFVRRKQGIDRLDAFFKNAEKAEVHYQQHAQNFHKMHAILKEIDDVQQEIRNIGFLHYFSDQKYRIRKSLNTRLEFLFSQLEEFSGEDKKNAVAKKPESFG